MSKRWTEEADIGDQDYGVDVEFCNECYDPIQGTSVSRWGVVYCSEPCAKKNERPVLRYRGGGRWSADESFRRDQ